jgi:hypothetical protein
MLQVKEAPILKDSDFHGHHEKLRIGKEERAKCIDIVKRDAAVRCTVPFARPGHKSYARLSVRRFNDMLNIGAAPLFSRSTHLRIFNH